MTSTSNLNIQNNSSNNSNNSENEMTSHNCNNISTIINEQKYFSKNSTFSNSAESLSSLLNVSYSPSIVNTTTNSNNNASNSSFHVTTLINKNSTASSRNDNITNDETLLISDSEFEEPNYDAFV